MPLTQTEFEALIGDTSKTIKGDIAWVEDEDHSPAVEFRVEISSSSGYPLFVRGSYNALSKSLSYTLIHRAVGRIYALDMGKDHHNPDCHFVGEKHKHRWNEALRDKDAYTPQDITALVDDPVAIWQQFCAEACIIHDGLMFLPPPIQLEIL